MLDEDFVGDGMSAHSLEQIATWRLGEPVGSWIARQRHPDEDIKRSWRKIARNLAEVTDGLVDVSGATVARWSRSYSEGVWR
jgi:hypothetical protein